MYLLLLAAALLFSFQFLFSKIYTRLRGDGAGPAFTFLLISESVSFLFMLVLNAFRLRFSAFSVILGLVYAVDNILFLCCGLRALTVANLSVYSVFTMLGGMLLPSVTGILFYREAVTVPLVLCWVLIFAALLLTLKKGNSGRRAYVYYIGVFLFNGLAAAISKVHQSSDLAVDSGSFVAIYNLWTAALCLGLYLVKFRTLPRVGLREVGCSAGYALCCGVPNLLLLIALTRLPASVQYPIVTGGVMFFSTVMSLLFREKLSRRELLAAGVAFLATVIIIL